MCNEVEMDKLRLRVSLKGKLEFDTAFHIGSGHEGLMATDMGVLLDPFDRPILPGSSLKGVFRATAERLAPHLGLRACLLDGSLSGVQCVTDEKYRKTVHEEFKEIPSDKKKLLWLKEHTCDVCRLFGSPYQGSRIFFSDGRLTSDDLVTIQVRDGVCINRDSGTAVDGLKYDFEVVPRETSYEILVELENPLDSELALIGAVVSEWEQGFRIGGFTSRGLGRAKLHGTEIAKVDYTKPSELVAYLLEKRMTADAGLLSRFLKQQLEQGAENA